MSLILDALRKMEQERKARRAAGDLRPEVLRYRGDIKPRQAKPYLLVATGLILLIAGAGAGFMLKGDGGATASDNTGQKPETAAAAALPPVAPPATVVVAPAPPPQPVASASAPVAAPAAAPVARSAPAETASASEASNSEPDSISPPVAAPKSKRSRKAVSAAAMPVDAPRISHAKRPQRASEDVQPLTGEITISGIAWQDKRHLRRAVLNGSLVGEGAEVAGARVVEIKENKVRVSKGGRLYDVPFSSGLSGR